VLDEVPEREVGRLGRGRVLDRNLVLGLAAGLLAGLEQQHRVALAREVRRERTAAGAGTDDDVLVLGLRDVAEVAIRIVAVIPAVVALAAARAVVGAVGARAARSP